MKALSIAVVIAGLSCGALGQGWFELDNSRLNPVVVADAPGGPYNGVFGLEVYELNGTNSDLVDALNWSGDYDSLIQNGFHIEATYTNQTMSRGLLQLGACRLPDVSPAGRTVTVALVLWGSSAKSYGAFLADANYPGLTGIIAFTQPTTDYTSPSQPSPPPMAWTRDEDWVLYCICTRPPVIGRQPQDAASVPGGTAAFAVLVASPFPPRLLNYYWLFNGNKLPATAYTSLVSTNPTFPDLITYSLILTNVQLTNAGQYSFVGTNLLGDLYGSVVSSNALLTVLPPPNLSIAPSAQGVTLSWPIWATNYALQETDNLGVPMTTWSNLAVSPVLGTNDICVTLQSAASHKFYRLRTR